MRLCYGLDHQSSQITNLKKKFFFEFFIKGQLLSRVLTLQTLQTVLKEYPDLTEAERLLDKQLNNQNEIKILITIDPFVVVSVATRSYVLQNEINSNVVNISGNLSEDNEYENNGHKKTHIFRL